MIRFLAAAALFAASAAVAHAEPVGKVGVDWLGNDIVVEAIRDPGVEGVTCHISYFERGMVDRLQKGNWFEDPSDTAISCRQTGPIKVGEIALGAGGEEVFKQGISLIWKKQVVNRIYDRANDTLIYLSHSRQVQDGSAKMAISSTTRATCASPIPSRAFIPRRSSDRAGWDATPPWASAASCAR